MSIKPLLNSNSIDNKTLNLFSNSISVNNVDASTINGSPIGSGGVQNPLTSNLKLGGFAIVEELGLSPSLNIDQLDNTKDIKLKIAGISKVDVKDNEVSLNENLNMNQNQIDNVLVVNNQLGQPLNLIGGSNVSAVILDATPTQGVIIGSNVGSSTDITGDTSLSLRSNAGSIDLFPSSVMGVVIGGLPRFAVDASETNIGNSLNMNNNNLNNVLNLNSSTNINLNPTGFVDCNGDIDMGSNRILGLNELVGTGGDLTIRNGGGESIILNSATNTIDILNNDLNMNNNNINNVSNLNVSSINGITPVGGLYASTSAGTLINNTTTQSLVALSGVGSLSIPPDGFSIGDCYHLVITGNCVFTNNDEIQITLKQNGNILAQTPAFLLEDANSGNNVFEIEADFNIRSISAGGSIHTSFEFTYNKDSIDSKDFRGTRSNDTQTINTTIASTLDVEFQFITKNASSSIQTQLFRLQKVY
jgi:hypothetical protein